MEDVLTFSEKQLQKTFEPIDSSFETGLEKLQQAYLKVGLNPEEGIITSKDNIAAELKSILTGIKTPDGFDKWTPGPGAGGYKAAATGHRRRPAQGPLPF